MNTYEWDALIAATRCPLCGLRHYKLNAEGKAVLDRTARIDHCGEGTNTGREVLDDEEDYVRPESCYVGGQPRVLKAQCSTCIGRPGNKMHLNPGRVKQMVQSAGREGSQGIICHQTLSYSGTETGGALCRWYYETYGHLNGFIRIMERIGGFTEIDPPKEET